MNLKKKISQTTPNDLNVINEDDSEDENQDSSSDNDKKLMQDIPRPRVMKLDSMRDTIADQYTSRPLRESTATEQGGLITERREIEELNDAYLLCEKLELKPTQSNYYGSTITPET